MKLFNRKTRIIKKVYQDNSILYFCQIEKIFGTGWKNMHHFEWPYVSNYFTNYEEAERFLYGNKVIKEEIIK